MKKLLFYLILALAVAAASGCTGKNELHEEAFSSLIKALPEKEEPTEISDAADIMPAELTYDGDLIYDSIYITDNVEYNDAPPEETEGLWDLKAAIEESIAAAEGEWAVYVKNVDTNEYLSINNHPMYSASLIKMFIMNAVYEKLENGELEKTEEISSLLTEMITVSDNDATNRLVEILGGGDFDAGLEVENDCTSRYGFADTKQQCDLQSVRTHPAKGRNYTSVNDCGKLLESICRKSLISYTASDEMIDLLFGQQVRYKIPAGVPDEAFVANKTGEMSSAQNDAAIVYSPNCLYIICIMSNELTEDISGSAINKIINISSMVYDYFN
ncbi:MAG: class A beta-lactamase-related serine hydrolase [Oscillospiraceae bacterium]|nr:class A beta-lactamase-related serine hydrolase [Oscillospiraceae bacterium]